MKLLILSDLHFTDYGKWNQFLEIDRNSFDIVLLLGDIDIMQLQSIKKNFKEKPMLGIHGNHDYPGDLTHMKIQDLHGKWAKFQNSTFLGVEACVRYKKGEAPLHEQDEISELLKRMPEVNIVMSHNSPFSIHDNQDNAHVGYEGLLRYIEEKKPNYVFHGHQHKNIRSRHHDTEVIGVYGGVIFDTNTLSLVKVLNVDEI